MHLNEIIETFDQIDEDYDVFKVETKADASYMVVAGLSDRSHIGSNEMAAFAVRTVSIRSAQLYSVYIQQMMSLSSYKDDLDEEIPEKIDKNPLGLHQTEIIALLAIDLLNASQNIINPVTNQPFNVKFGK